MNLSNLKTLILKVDGRAHILTGKSSEGERACLVYLINPAPICKVYFMFRGQETVQARTLSDEPKNSFEQLQHLRDLLKDKERGQLIINNIDRMTDLFEKLELLDKIEAIHDAKL